MTGHSQKSPVGVSGPVQLALLRAHAVAVSIPLLLWAVQMVMQPPGSGGGVNFGAVFAGLPLVGLGLPWSLLWPAVFDAYGPDRSFAQQPLMVAWHEASHYGGALLNLFVHVLVYRWFRHRRERSAPL